MGASPLVLTGLGFIVMGLLLKAALFPLHYWLVHSYTYAPTLFTAFFSATATKVSIYLLMRIIFGLFGWSLLPATIIMILAAGAIIVGSIAALREQDVKRMLAFSSVAQIGYMVFALSLGSSAGLAAALLHLLLHAPAKAGLFLCVAVVERQRGGSTLAHFKGLGKTMPMMATAFVICGFSLIGIPLTAGFLSKWLLLSSMMQAGQWAGLGLILISSLFAVIYVGKVLEAMFYQKESESAVHKGEVAWPLIVPLILLSAACIYFGLFSEGVMQLVQNATNLYFRAGE
jgi:multicomponent Na+:H+ antiporter subunit D